MNEYAAVFGLALWVLRIEAKRSDAVSVSLTKMIVRKCMKCSVPNPQDARGSRLQKSGVGGARTELLPHDLSIGITSSAPRTP